jgi:hypothetical protein
MICLKTGYGANGEWKVRVNAIDLFDACCPTCTFKKATERKKEDHKKTVEIHKEEFRKKFWEVSKLYLNHNEYKFTGKVVRRTGAYLEDPKKFVMLGQLEHNCGFSFFRKIDALYSAEYDCPICDQFGFDRNNKKYDGLEELPDGILLKIESGAKKRRGGGKRNLEFNVTKEYLWKLYLEQGGLCKFSGVRITFGAGRKREAKEDFIEKTASLDRIDSSKGYVEGNVQWVHKSTNYMKQAMKDEEFIEWCDKISSFRVRGGNGSTIIYTGAQDDGKEDLGVDYSLGEIKEKKAEEIPEETKVIEFETISKEEDLGVDYINPDKEELDSNIEFETISSLDDLGMGISGENQAKTPIEEYDDVI